MNEKTMIDEPWKIMNKYMKQWDYLMERFTKIEHRLTELEEASEEEVSEELSLFMRIVERGMKEEIIIMDYKEGEGDE